MTANEFDNLCASLLIAPSVALENENVREALKERKPIKEIRHILETEF